MLSIEALVDGYFRAVLQGRDISVADIISQVALTGPMADAVTFAKANGNKLIRYPGGFWCAEGTREPYVGTSTVAALVRRGVMKYTKYQPHSGGGAGEFPIEATLV